jgi:hypothetical protein
MDDAEELKAACLADIRDHYRQYGATRWKLVMVKHPEIDERHFWRLVKKVKEGLPDQEILRFAVKKAKHAAKRLVPAAPSPAMIAAGGAETERNIDFMMHLQELLADAEMIRTWSMTDMDEDGMRKIKNPMFFAKSISLRRELLETALRAMQEIWDLRKMSDFYNTIIDTISQADPATARLIMEKLDALNNERGLTIDAVV